MPECFSPYMKLEPNADTLRSLIEAAGGQCVMLPPSPFLLKESQSGKGSRRGSQSQGSTGSQTAAAEMELAIADLCHGAAQLLPATPRPLLAAMQQLARGVPIHEQPAMQTDGPARALFDDCHCLVIAGSGPTASVGSAPEADQLRAMQMHCGWPLVAPAWVIHSISAFERQPLERFLLYNPNPIASTQSQAP
jgi:hypothetical protein